jgi:hypothetical protein
MQKIGFSASNGFLSRMIRKVTSGETSHCFILFNMEGSNYDPVLVFESGNKGPAFVEFSEFIKSNRIIELIDSKVDLMEGIEAYSQCLGKDYDFAGLVGGLFVMVGRAFGKVWRNPLNTNKLTCIELTLGILTKAKYPGIEEFSKQCETPQDLLDFLRKGE